MNCQPCDVIKKKAVISYEKKLDYAKLFTILDNIINDFWQLKKDNLKLISK